MNKLTLTRAFQLFTLMGVILIFTTSQQVPPKDLTVKGQLSEFQNLVNCLEQSNASHLNVQAALNFVVPQLQKQLAGTTKPKK